MRHFFESVLNGTTAAARRSGLRALRSRSKMRWCWRKVVFASIRASSEMLFTQARTLRVRTCDAWPVDDRSVSGSFENTNMKRVIGLVERSFCLRSGFTIAVRRRFRRSRPQVACASDRFIVGHSFADRAGDLFLRWPLRAAMAGRLPRSIFHERRKFRSKTRSLSDMADDGADLGESVRQNPRWASSQRLRESASHWTPDLFADRGRKANAFPGWKNLPEYSGPGFAGTGLGSDRVVFLWGQDGFPKRMKTRCWAALPITRFGCDCGAIRDGVRGTEIMRAGIF